MLLKPVTLSLICDHFPGCLTRTKKDAKMLKMVIKQSNTAASLTSMNNSFKAIYPYHP